MNGKILFYAFLWWNLIISLQIYSWSLQWIQITTTESELLKKFFFTLCSRCACKIIIMFVDDCMKTWLNFNLMHHGQISFYMYSFSQKFSSACFNNFIWSVFRASLNHFLGSTVPCGIILRASCNGMPLSKVCSWIYFLCMFLTFLFVRM